MNTLEAQTDASTRDTPHPEHKAKLERYFELFQQPTEGAELTNKGQGQDSVERLTDQISDLIAPEIIFKDPFQQIQGTEAFCKLLNHFHHNVQQARFDIEAVCPLPNHQVSSQSSNKKNIQDKEADQNSSNEIKWLVKWHFSGQLQGIGDWQFPGVSEITQDSQGRICHHIDYWDASEHFYNKLPVLGRILSWLKNKIARASQA